MKNIQLLLLVFFLFSCANSKEGVDFYDNYVVYAQSVKDNNVFFVKEMLSAELREKVDTYKPDDFPILTEFPNVLVDIESHYQIIKNNKGCLTLNGYDDSSSPVSLFLEYSNENSRWLLAYVEIFYPDSSREFKNIGICPTRL